MSREMVHLLGVLWLCWWWLASSGEAQVEYLRYKDPKQPVATRVKDLLSRMTLEEKIGQMAQIDRSVANEKVMKTSFIGSVLSGGGSEPLPKATAQDWVNMINEFQKGALASRLGIPMIYGIDALHGHNNVYNATIFPHNVGLGCTRDPELVQRIGAATALEVRATGIPYVFAPCIAVCRDPRWGRCYESYSEDPKIVQEMTAIIPGLQGDIPANSRKGFPYVGGKTKVAACAKHFVGDGGTTKGINENNTVTDWHGLLSIHMPAYSDSIIKGVSTVMVSYSSWNGVKMHANRDLVTGFLKNTLKFKGFVITDWQGIDRITTPPNYTYSVQASIEAGIDMVMVPYKYDEFIQDLTLLVKNGVIPMERIDDAVERILFVKFTMGLFENPLADFSLVNVLGSQEHRDLAREAVRKSLVLLKNGKNESAPLLPLPKKLPKLLVAGTHADNLGYQCGGWTITWQGFSGNTDTRGTTILGAIKSTVDPSTEVIFHDNPDGEFVKSNNFEYAIVVIGEPPYAETAGDSTTLTMMDPGPNVINNVCGAIKCVVVVISGRPIVIEPYVSSIDALVAAWLPGTEGQGVTDLLFGDYGFSGKLARTWFKSIDQLPMNVGDAHYDPLFPFGFGLTTESVKDLVARSTSGGVGLRACIFTFLVTVIISLYLTGSKILKKKTIDSFFKRKERDNEEVQAQVPTSILDTNVQPPPSKTLRIEQESVNVDTLIRDPGKRLQIWNYPINQQDKIRRAYIKFGPYQFLMDSYPLSGQDHPRRFQAHWFRSFSWLEYSPEEDVAFCLPCYLFSKKSSPITSKGFRNWRKVNNGKDCAFLTHIGKSPNSPHNVALKCYEDFKKESCHIDKVLSKQSSQQILSNRLRLKASVDAVRWLTFQACAFRGNDESVTSKNRGNFLEMIKLLASYNKEVDEVVLENAPQNARYTSPIIQKEILHVFARRVQNEIREEIGDAKFCLIVDEARDESKREQMALIIRFVDKSGYVKERFLDIIHVRDTTSSTLKQGICSILSHHNLNIENVRGQGYDGASNMRGEWNGLQALVLQECPYAYYVHCLAHQLQLALVASAKEVIDVHAFFQNLTFIVNVVCSSCKLNDELQAAYANEIARLVANDEIETGRGANQIGTLQRPGDTRWSSHFNSICSLLRMYGATSSILEDLIDRGSYNQRGDAAYALKALISFDFVFILHMMKEVMGITDKLCQALQQKSQDILNAMCLVSSTKSLIQNLKDSGWNSLLERVTSFYHNQTIQIPDMNASFFDIIRSRRQKDSVTVEHHYRIDIFNTVIDYQLKELNSRFNKQSTELLSLSCALDPKDAFKSFNAGDICSLVEKFYSSDFSDQEKTQLEYELQHYDFDVIKDANFQNLSTVGELCQKLVETSKSNSYPLIDRLLRLVLTLPVSTATTECAFSAMKIIKTRLRNKMEDGFLTNYMIVYIEKEIAEKFTTDMIIDDFYLMKQ